jgi:hypothetical protein
MWMNEKWTSNPLWIMFHSVTNFKWGPLIWTNGWAWHKLLLDHNPKKKVRIDLDFNMLKYLNKVVITLHYTSQQRQGPHINEICISMGQPLDVFEDLSISMTMVPPHSVKKGGPKSSCKWWPDHLPPTELG